MANTDYAKLVCFMGLEDGALVYLGESTSVEMVTEAGNIRVDTLDGFSGFSDGSGSVKLNLGYAIPKGGPEFPFQQCAAGDSNGNKPWVNAQFGVGAGAYVGTGKINTCTESQSTNAAAEGRCEWEGEIKPIE